MLQGKTKLREIAPTADYIFESAWEVCNKVGGIYTVLSSKASGMIDYYQGRYFLVGPYIADRVKGEFEESSPPDWLKKTFEEMEKQGIKCHFGAWLISGEPPAILIDFQDIWPQVNTIKRWLWDNFQIDSLNTANDFNEPIVWAFALGKLLEAIQKHLNGKKIVGHFHEWLSATALLYLKKATQDFSTVFTTHATTVGRTLAFNNINFYQNIADFDADEIATRYNIKAKHQVEKQAALNCSCFTTVSQITAMEASFFLNREADVILPNGLDAEKFLTFEDLTIKHQFFRNRLREFSIFYFFPYYTFDLENTLFYFISGRYEYRAKGVDIFIEALSELNKKLIAEKSRKTIVAFFWIPAAVRAVEAELLENREFFEGLKESLEEVEEETEDKMLYAIAEGKEFSSRTLFSSDFLFSVKKKLLKLKRKGVPPLATHELLDENDTILNAFRAKGLNNAANDRVKVIFYPTYLTGHDGLSNLSYADAVQACHLGVFPSFYEPWGYTPLETAGVGVASITTDMAGFGSFCASQVADKRTPGIFILKRMEKTDQETSSNLADILYKFARLSKKERVDNKIQARKLAALADWSILDESYIKAHNFSLQNGGQQPEK